MALNKANNIPNDGIANPFINLNGNVASLGRAINTPNRGAAAVRPTTPVIGDQFFDTTTNILQIFTTNGWVAAATKPDAPVNVVAASAFVPYGGLPGVRVTWGTATTAVPAASYTVTSNTGGFTATTTTNEVTFLGLNAGTSYTFTVAATNNYGSSSATSNAISPVTSPQAITVGTPVATAEGLSVPVTPGETGGSAITGYTLFAQPGNIVVTSPTVPVVFRTNVPITGGPIAVGTRYSFSGIANNVAGPSTLSNTSPSELNKPRFVTTGLTADYDFYAGSYGGQNLLLHSEAPATSPWFKIGGAAVTVTNNAATDPLGGSTAATVTQVGGVGGESIVQNAPITGNRRYRLSVYVKAPSTGAATSFVFASFFTGNSTVGNSAQWNPVDGAFQGGDSSATVEDVGSGWRRYTLIHNGSNSLNTNHVWQIYTTQGTIQVWGAQLQDLGVGGANVVAPGYLKTTSSQINYTTGSTVYDLSGNGNNWTANNFTYSTTPTNGNGALMFNGTNTGGTLPSFGSSISNYSFSFWSNRAQESRMLIAGSAGYQFGDNSWASSGGEWYYPRVGDRGLNVWNHTVIAVSSNRVYNIYHNGYFEGQNTMPTDSPANFSSVVLGNGFGGLIWQGALGRMSLYINKTLTATEVLQNFNADRQRYGF